MNRLTVALDRVYFPPRGRITDDTSVLTLRSLVFEPLCQWRDGAVGPALFVSWRHDAEGRVWHFSIRPGARFHDGLACTVEHVRDSIAATLEGRDMFGMPWSYARYLAGARIEAADAMTLRIATPEPLADLPEILAEFFVARDAPDGQALIGTGPYCVAALRDDAAVDLDAVEAGRQPARLRFVAEKGAEARFAMLLDGSVDVALNLDRRAAAPGGHGLRWGRVPTTLSVMFYLNCTAGLFASRKARLAANLAVDRPAILRHLFHGLGVPAASIVSPFHLGMAEAGLARIPYDPDRARRLFAEAGAGAEILIRTPTHMPERAPDIAAMVARDLAEAGCPARIEVVEDRPDYARQVGDKRIGDMAIFDSSPHSTFRVLNDKISAASCGIWWQGHDDPALEPMILAANHTMEHDARAAAYARCLARLQADPPWLYLFHPEESYAARPGVTGLTMDHRGVLGFGGGERG
ncbi:ABC transporter substrate-binding protein [Falsiroseomonas sp. HC035]|uniref:ABC transporter substrate-binding protein n=1 Tax=Falsiroseomonas sp. HC035 TaxID=3390999 RepID=UPI003D31EFFC